MQRLKQAIKKMVAIGTGVAMLGATITGAVAQDLADYPAPFVDKNGVFDESTAIIVGDSAAASDTLGAIDVATNLQFMAKTPVSSGAGTIQVSGGVTEDIPLGISIANSTSFALDWAMDDADISSFMDTTVQFQGKDYDVHDELAFTKVSPSIETSLTSSDDDYESNVLMEAKKKSIHYFLMVDDGDLNITKATSTEPFEVKFLGKTLKITAVENGYNDRFTAYVGTEYFMDVGDVVTVDGKKVTLVNVGSGGSIIVDVDGTIETIPAASTKTINGIEVTVDETFYANTKSERAASLVIGKDSQATYKNDDAYIGEDAAHPNWKWAIGNLGTKSATYLDSGAPVQGVVNATGPYISIYNNFRKTSDSDNPAGVGECYDLPNNYASICMDSLTVADDDYLTVTIEYTDSASLDDSGDANMSTSQKAIYIHAEGSDRFKIPANILPIENGTVNNIERKTSEIWLSKQTANYVGVYYRDTESVPDVVLVGSIDIGGTLNAPKSTITGKEFALLNYKDTKDSNINFSFYNASATMATLSIIAGGDSTTELPFNTDTLELNFTMTDDDFTKLGATASKEEDAELLWGNTLGIGSKDENHRTKYGIVVKDPKSNGASDQVVLEIPADQVQANVVVKGQASTVAGGSTSYIPADITIDTKLSSEVAGSETAHNLILVGGPCANPTVEKVSSLGKTCSGWDLGAGEAIVKMAANGNKVALLVAGTDAIDTRMAAKVVANYGDYQLSGSQVTVTGSLSAPVIKVA